MMMHRIATLLFALGWAGLSSSALGFGTFDAESRKVSKAVACEKPKIQGAGAFPPLYSCIGGEAETVKVFINGEAASKKTFNLKFLWNDWTRDIGYGIHADKDLANAWLSSLATIYAPEQVAEVLSAFSGKKAKSIVNDRYILTYTFVQGPSIAERMFVVTAR